MGADVVWQDKSVATISLNGEEYVLNTDECTLRIKSTGANTLFLAPGANHGIICKMISGDFICDNDTLLGFLVYVLGAKMNIDFEQAIININF